jgi:hypothetical protein
MEGRWDYDGGGRMIHSWTEQSPWRENAEHQGRESTQQLENLEESQKLKSVVT